MDRKGLQGLAHERRQDAAILLNNGRYAAAYYLSGYVIECALKACISKTTRMHEFPDRTRVSGSWTHKLTELRKIAKLEVAMEADMKGDLQLAKNWSIVKDWTEISRYTTISRKRAEALFASIDDPQHGVLQWITQHW